MNNRTSLAEHKFLAPFFVLGRWTAGRNRQLGAELELVVISIATGQVVSDAHLILDVLWRQYPERKACFDKEFSGHQIEIKAGPCATSRALTQALNHNLHLARWAAHSLGYRLEAIEWLEGEIPINLSPLEARYAAYAKDFPNKVDAMCRTASTHVHFGVGSPEEALAVYNRLVEALPELIALGWVDTRRLRAFDSIIFPPRWSKPPVYADWSDFYEHAVADGFHNGKQRNYACVRLHDGYPTVEFRLMGPVDDMVELRHRVEILHRIAYGV